MGHQLAQKLDPKGPQNSTKPSGLKYEIFRIQMSTVPFLSRCELMTQVWFPNGLHRLKV
jgi:hypothetical protein